MRSIHGLPARALRRVSGSIAVCCVLGAGVLAAGPAGGAHAVEGPGGAPLTPAPLTPAASPGAGSGGPAAPAPVSSGSPSAGGAAGPGADLALRTEFTARAPSTAPPSTPPAVPTAERLTAGAPAPAPADGTYVYRVTAVNHGPSRAVDVVVTDELPRALVFVSSPDGCTAQGRTITCGPLATLAVGRSHSWLIHVALAPDYTGDGTDITNVVAVTSQTADPDPGNNTDTLTGLPVPPGAGSADLSLRKTAELPPGSRRVTPGQTFTYRITVHNLGPSAARGVQVTDPLPELLRFVSSPDCRLAAGSAQRVVCPVPGPLPAGQSVTHRIVVQVRESAPRYGGGDSGGHGGGGHGGGGHGGGRVREIDNIASVTSVTRDPVPGNNSNPSGTTGPDGGPLFVVHPHRPTHPPTHPPRPTDPGKPHPGKPHPGGPQLPDTGREVPGWLPWSAGLTLAAGCALVVLGRRIER
ncbi:DUF11 domain-containing protein [Streptomyces sp. NPDC001889]